MKSLGSILDLVERKDKCRISMHIHDLPLDEVNLLQKRLGNGFSRSNKEHPKCNPPYESTDFDGYGVLGYEAIHITTYRDTITKEKGGE